MYDFAPFDGPMPAAEAVRGAASAMLNGRSVFSAMDSSLGVLS